MKRFWILFFSAAALLGSFQSAQADSTSDLKTLMQGAGYSAWWVGSDYASGTWTDRVNARAVTAVNASGLTTSTEGLVFSGGYFTGDAAANPLSNVQDFTILTGFKTTQTGVNNDSWYQNPTFIDNELPGADQDWGLSLDQNGKLIAGIGKSDYNQHSSAKINDGTFHVGAYTYAATSASAGKINLYVDGAYDSNAVTGTSGSRKATTFTIGTCQTNKSLLLNGTVQEFRIYSRALSAAEVAAQTDEMTNGTLGQYWHEGSSSWLSRGAADAAAVSSPTAGANANLYVNAGTVTGSLATSKYLFIGLPNAASESGAGTVSGATSLQADQGIYLRKGGTISSTSGTLNLASPFTQDGGTLTAANLTNASTVTMNAGTFTATGTFTLGGTVNLNGGTLKAGNMTGNSKSINLNGGTLEGSATLSQCYIYVNVNSVLGANVTQNEGSLNLNSNTLTLGKTVAASYTSQGNAAVSGGSGTVNLGDGANGTFNMGTSVVTVKTMNVGQTSNGFLNQISGVATLATVNVGGASAAAVGQMKVTGGNLTYTTLNVGTSAGSGTVTQTNGVMTGKDVNVGANGTYALSGGTLKSSGTITGAEKLVVSGSGTLVANTIQGNVIQNGGYVSAAQVNGNYTLNDGTVRIGDSSGLSYSRTNFYGTKYYGPTAENGGGGKYLPTTLAGWNQFWTDIDAMPVTATGTVSGIGANINKDSYYTVTYSGQLFLSEEGTFKFQEVCDDGSFLYVDGNLIVADYNGRASGNTWGNHVISDAVTLSAGYHDFQFRYFQGYGGAAAALNWQKLVDGNWTSFSNLNDAPVLFLKEPEYATMNVAGDFTQNGGTVEMEINFDTGEFDQIVSSGNLFAENTKLVLNVYGEVPDGATEFELFKSADPNAALNLDFSDFEINLFDSLRDATLDVSALLNGGTLGVVGLPEPSAWALMMFGILGVGFLRRRRS